MKRIFFVMSCLVGLSSACLDEPVDSKTNALTKEEARQQQKSDSRDLCEVFDWYGDGVCDDFCAGLDPDCGVTCLAYPACEAGQVEVDECDLDQPGCTAPSICGSTIYCQEGISQCQAYPSCGTTKIEVDSCSPDSDCEEVSICGYTILCESPIVCEAYPVCPEETEEVDECGSSENCKEHTVCGTTILCREAVFNCLAYPVCPEGHTEVQECAVDEECPTASMCGKTIICQPNGM